jgi:hypothetical protein
MALRYRTDIAAPFFLPARRNFCLGMGNGVPGKLDSLEQRKRQQKSPLHRHRSAYRPAFYAAITFVFQPLSYGYVQIRISEILTVLPAFTPAAIPGLFIGCIVSNLASPSVPSISRSAALRRCSRPFYRAKCPQSGSSRCRPSSATGAVIVGIELHYLLHTPLNPFHALCCRRRGNSLLRGRHSLMFALKKVSRRLFG